MKINDLLIIFVFFIICLLVIGKYAYNDGFYDGMKELCEDELFKDEQGNIYCEEVKKEIINYNFLEVRGLNDDN